MWLSTSPCCCWFWFVCLFFFSLQVDNSRKFLNTIEKQVALFDCRLILCILRIGTVCLDNSANFIDLAVQSATGNEAGNFSVGEEEQEEREKGGQANHKHHAHRTSPPLSLLSSLHPLLCSLTHLSKKSGETPKA